MSESLDALLVRLNAGDELAVKQLFVAFEPINLSSPHVRHLARAAGAPAALAGIPLNMHAIDQALHSVVDEVDMMGSELGQWLDDMHLTPLAVVATVAAASAGAVYYVRYRSDNGGKIHNEEDSSSWLFARLHTFSR